MEKPAFLLTTEADERGSGSRKVLTCLRTQRPEFAPAPKKNSILIQSGKLLCIPESREHFSANRQTLSWNDESHLFVFVSRLLVPSPTHFVMHIYKPKADTSNHHL